MEDWQSLAYRTDLENQRSVKAPKGSNPLSSAWSIRLGVRTPHCLCGNNGSNPLWIAFSIAHQDVLSFVG